MIIDLILDRRDDEKDIENGITEVTMFNGETRSLYYSPRKFYHNIMSYGEIGYEISRAMDYGTNKDVQKALCNYIVNNDYNTDICDYINSVEWL